MIVNTIIRRKKIPVFSLLLVIILTGGCSSTKIKIEEIAAPADSIKGISEPSYGSQVIGNVNLKLIDIKERFGDFESRIITLPKPTNWREIAEFYDDELGKKGFSRSSNVPSDAIDSDIIYYEQKSVMANQKAAVSLIETYKKEGEVSPQFLLLCVSN